MIHPLCRGHRRIYKLKERLHCIPHKMDKFCRCRDGNLSRYKENSRFSTKVLKHDIIGTIEKWPPFCFFHHSTVVSSKGWILLFLSTNHYIQWISVGKLPSMDSIAHLLNNWALIKKGHIVSRTESNIFS